VYALNGHFEEEVGISAMDRGMWRVWPCVRESIEEKERIWGKWLKFLREKEKVTLY